MSLPDPAPPRKLNRLGLFAPFIAVAIAFAVWSGFWIWARGEVAGRMDADVARLADAGYPVVWKTRTIGGYPFRMDVSLTEVTARAPSGWSASAPRVEGEAQAYALTHWLIAAPDSLTFVRPLGGAVTVKGKLIRASLTDFDKRPPSLSFEGVNLTFQPQAGALPFALASAGRVEFHLRAGPDDEGGVFATLDGGKASAAGLFATLSGGKPIAMVWNSTLSKMSAFTGRDWRSAIRHWTDAGGQMTVRNAGLTAGDVTAAANSGTLGVDRDGRLSGVLDATLHEAPRALTAMGQSGLVAPETAQAAALVTLARQDAGQTARATINFQAGQTTLGPVALGLSPKAYDTP